MKSRNATYFSKFGGLSSSFFSAFNNYVPIAIKHDPIPQQGGLWFSAKTYNYGGKDISTTSGAMTGMIAPQKVLEPSADTADLKAYVWWEAGAVDPAGGIIGPSVVPCTVGWGVQLSEVAASATPYGFMSMMKFATCGLGIFGGTPMTMAPRDINGAITPAYLAFAKASLGYTGTDAALARLVDAITPQIAMGYDTVPVTGKYNLYRTQLRMVYDDNGTVRTTDKFSFRNFRAIMNDYVMTSDPLAATVSLGSSIVAQPVAQAMMVHRMSAGSPASGPFKDGTTDFNGDGLVDSDTHNAVALFFGVEIQVI